MPLEFKDYYAVLGVPRTATAEEIKKAFRALARKNHPDVAVDKKGAEARFKEINEAHEVLSDPEKRKKYDTLGAQWQDIGEGSEQRSPRRRAPTAAEGPGAHEFEFGGTGFSDFFERFFSGDFEPEHPGSGGRRQRAHARGADIEGDLAVSLEEAAHGAVRTVSLRRVDPDTSKESVVSFRVRIPAGVTGGQIIRVPGKGDEGASAPGDLFLRVRLAAHPDFEPRGADLYTELAISPWEAALGSSVPAPTLDGPVTVRLPAGAQSGQTLRLRGRGLPKAQDGSGDLFVTLAVRMPPAPTPAQKDLWEKLAQASGFDPRETTED